MQATKECGAVVVLYRPTPAQLERLPALRERCAALVVVDNSPVRDIALRCALGQHGIQFQYNGNRGGIAGAFNLGIEVLQRQGLQCFSLFDQDSQVPDDYFERVALAAQTLGDSPWLLGPRIYDVHARQFLPSWRASRWGFRVLDVATLRDGAPQPCSYLISSGMTVNLAAWQALGAMREDYFIDHVDTEYCLRAQKLGVPMYLLPGLDLPHAIGQRVVRRVLGLRIGAMNHGAVRRYYLARNGLHLSLRGVWRWPPALLLNLLTLSQALAVLLVEREAGGKLLALACGVCDGLTGRLGPLESRWPRLARRWSARP